MMNGSKSCDPPSGFYASSPKRRRPRLRVSCFPSPHPSPRGEGETFARALVIRPNLVFVCLRNERQRSGDCNRNVRIFQSRASALPLLGERVGVRGNRANSNPRRTTIPGTVKLRSNSHFGVVAQPSRLRVRTASRRSKRHGAGTPPELAGGTPALRQNANCFAPTSRVRRQDRAVRNLMMIPNLTTND